MWTRETFKIATDEGKQEVDGVTAKGLGMHFVRKWTLGGPPPLIRIVHLNSGHQIALVRADFVRAGQIAAELIAAGDWDFTGLHGYQNMSPDLPAKFHAVLARHNDVLVTPAKRQADERIAREISRERA